MKKRKAREFLILVYYNGYICAAGGDSEWHLAQDTKPELLRVREVLPKRKKGK